MFGIYFFNIVAFFRNFISCHVIIGISITGTGKICVENALTIFIDALKN